MEWSSYQRDVFVDVQSGQGHTVVEAVAGSGKTTTIQTALKYVRARRVLYCAFNKTIADGFRPRAPRNVKVSTCHGIGMRCCFQMLDRRHGRDAVKIDVRKNVAYKRARRLIEAHPTLSKQTIDDVLPYAVKAASWIKNTLQHTEDGISDVASDWFYEIHAVIRAQIHKRESEAIRLFHSVVDGLIGASLRAFDRPVDGRVVMDFDDMIWLPPYHDFQLSYFDFIFGDEVQDWNAAQLKLIKGALRRGGRLIAVGDENQAIYYFRGADKNAIRDLKRTFGAKSLPLSITYRCARSITAVAQKMVPEIRHAPGAPEGEVCEASSESALRVLKAGDFLLSRLNAPLSWFGARLWEADKLFKIAGSDPVEALCALVRHSRAETRDELVEWLDDQIREAAESFDERPTIVARQLDNLMVVRNTAENARNPKEVTKRLREMHADIEERNAYDPAKHILLSTVHKAKGEEADRVFTLERTFHLSFGDPEEEENIYYVAVTRAKRVLTRVYDQPWRFKGW